MSSNNRTTSTFHNPKYAEYIACNHCANACEYCGSLHRRKECKNDDKMHRTSLLLCRCL